MPTVVIIYSGIKFIDCSGKTTRFLPTVDIVKPDHVYIVFRTCRNKKEGIIRGIVFGTYVIVLGKDK